MEDGTPVYDRTYENARMNFTGRSFALSSAAASKHEIEYFDQHTGEAKKIDNWVGKIGVACINEHPCRQGTLSCCLCGVRFKYDTGPTPGDTPACTYAGAHTQWSWPSFQEACYWGQGQEACDFYGVNPPPKPVRPSTAASSTEAWPEAPPPRAQSSAHRPVQTRDQNAYFAEQRKWQRDQGAAVPFNMNAAGQSKMARQKDKHAEDWLKLGHEWDQWRLEKSHEGKSKDQTAMLSHRPWACGDPAEKPPNCDTELLHDFKTMVLRFLSHAEWRQVTYGEREPPKPKAWLIHYWNTYLDYCTKNDRGLAYGPLWNYLKYEAKADECFNTPAGLGPPHQKVKQWQEWEETMKWHREQIFWNPAELLED